MVKKLRLKEVAALLRRHPLTIRNWFEAGKMPVPVHIDPSNPYSPLVWDDDIIDRFIEEATASGWLRPKDGNGTR